MFSRRLFKSIILILTVASCTVLENRADCPCDLFLNLSSPTCECYDQLHVVVCDSLGHVECEADVLRPDYAQGLRLSVGHHDRIFVVVYPKGLQPYFDAGRCMIKAGEVCPELYLCNASCNTLSDHCEVDVVLHKNYCKVNVVYATNSDGDMLMEMRCRFAGLDSEGTPVMGEYRIHEGIKGDSVLSLMVPRQGDDSMVLSIYSISGSTRNYALGNALALGGYDWTKKDLDDVTVTVDYTSSSLSVHVPLWTDEIFIPVVV